jgi:outer membrane immunogenic protein
MSVVWRLAAPSWPISALVVGLAFLFSSNSALAQSADGVAISAATGRSLADAVSQNEKVLIDQQLLGAPPPGGSTAGGGGGGGGGAGAGGGAAAAAMGAIPTGRVRTSDHDGLKGSVHYAFSTNEASTFGNIVVTVPGTVLGGQVKFSGLVGRNNVSLDLKSNAAIALEPNQSGSASNDSILVGGTALWARKSTYALATVVGTWGQTTLKDSVDDCGYAAPSPTGCNHQRYNFNTAGFIGNVTAGNVFDLGGASGPKLDLRGSLGYAQNKGDSFKNIHGDRQNYTFSTWTGTGAATLFSNLTLPDNALLRPYLQGYVRQEFGYRNSFMAIESDNIFLGNFLQTQAHTYGGVDAGLTYTQGNTTVGAAIYYEASGDERTLGGRLGMSQKLDDLVGAAQAKKRFNWSGFYAGVNAGGASADARTSTSMTCIESGPPFPVPPVDCEFTQPQFPAIGAAGTATLSDRGFTGGAQAGLNMQTGSTIFGLEVDVQSFRLAASQSVTSAIPAGFVTGAGSVTVGTSFDTNWLFTARSRLGLAISPNVLLYGTSGLAVTELGVRNSFSSTVSPVTGAANDSGRLVGWTVGGGAEWALDRHWSIRAEYLYLDFGKVAVNAQVGAFPFLNNLATTVDLNAQIVRGGLNYKF